MSYNPFIQRILIEQIQEFELLDVEDLALAADPDKLNLIAFDIFTRKFFWFQYDLTGGGSIIINQNAYLTRDHTVNTDDLSVPRGFKFNSGWNIDDVVNALCNPPVLGILTFSAAPYLVEVNAQTPVNLAYIWDKKSEGDIIIAPVDSRTYYRGNIAIPTIPDQLTATSEGIITYKIEFRVDATPQFPSSIKTATDTVKAIYPFIIGAGPSNTLASIGNLDSYTRETLHDIKASHYLIANMDGLIASASPIPSNFYWFAVHDSMTPVSWAAIDSNGLEDPLNSGPIGTAYSNIGNLTYKGNSFKIYMGVQETYYGSRIKIKF